MLKILMIIETLISSFKSTRKTEVDKNVEIGDVLKWFKNGKFKSEVSKIRSGDSEVKKNLPTFAFHGVFDGFREKNKFIEASGIIILDLDDVDINEIEETKADIMECSDNVFAIMTSPSGNGIKILYLVESSLVTHNNYKDIGKIVSEEFKLYGHVDVLSVSDCLIATYDTRLLINEDATPAFVHVEDKVFEEYELAERDFDKPLWEDVDDFFDTVLVDSLVSSANNKFHFIQMSILDLAKFGFRHPKHDLSFVLDYTREHFGSSAKNKTRFDEVVRVSEQYPQKEWAYKLIVDGDEDEGMPDLSDYIDDDDGYDQMDGESVSGVLETALIEGMVNYENFFDKVLASAMEGDRVGAETSLKSFSDIFRWKGSGILTVTGIPGHGKCLSLDSEVYTPTGSKTMGEIKVGEEVLTRGGVANVVGVYPQGVKNMYNITFSDNTVAESCDEHLWLCNDRKGRLNNTPMKVMKLKDMMGNITVESDNRKNYNIPVETAFFDGVDLEFDPYCLGLLLGDGSLGGKTIKFTNGELEPCTALRDELNNVGYDLGIKECLKKYECWVRLSKNKSNVDFSLNDFLDINDLRVNSYKKHIPEKYLINSIDNRWLLLQGLLDTDGSIDKSGGLTFSTSSEKMKDDFMFLIQSLGGTCTISRDRFPSYKSNGKVKISKNKNYELKFVLKKEMGCPFSKCSYKKERWEKTFSKKNEPRRFISKVEFSRKVEAQCIAIDGDSHLFFTNNFTVTHNTEFVDSCVLDLARLHGHGSLVVGFEQTPEEHVIKLMRKMVGVNVTQPSYFKSNKDVIKDAYSFVTDHIKHINTTKVGGDINTILETSAAHIKSERDAGKDVKYLVVDPFNMLSVKGRFIGHEKIEEILRRLTHFSHQMGVLVVLVAHPFKMKKDEKTGKYEMPDFYSVKGSSAFFEMSYHGLVVYRDGYESDSTVTVRVLKVKQNNLGRTGAESKFRYHRDSGRYIPIDQEGLEEKGDHRSKDWLDKVKNKLQ